VARLRSARFDGYIAGDVHGIPVIFLHGWAGSKDIWLGLLERCPPGYFFVSLDLPGTGGTPALTTYQPDAFADWLANVADELGIDKFCLVGHSMGGNIATWAAVFLPDRVQSVTLISPALASPKIAAAGPFLSAFGPINIAISRLGAAALGLVDVAHPHRHTGGVCRSWFRRFVYVYRDNTVDGLLDQLKFLIANPVSLTQAPDHMQIQIIQGCKDATISIESTRAEVRKRRNNTTLMSFRNGLHCPMDEQQAETLSLIVRFVGETLGGSTDII
jgi:pimeloyl-ACP methyl ester carboxylesterase